MGRESFKPTQEIPPENEENNGEGEKTIEETGTEERVVREIPPSEAESDQEALQEPGTGIYEAPLDPTEEE